MEQLTPEEIEAREEARLMNTLGSAKVKAKAGFGVRKISTGATAAPEPVRRPSTGAQPRRDSNGPLPAWKQKLLEAEQREKERIAEEERIKKEKLHTLQHVTDDKSTPYSTGALHHETTTSDVEAQSETHYDVSSPGRVVSESIAKKMDEEEMEEMLRREEERMMRKTKGFVPPKAQQ
eukprot:TRINITY_DN9611_c0_g1_i1.p1 TRINITY_DN9611_c0_g1~~TRINITY_DN9611_c0_g1_i1.p1  ORF type:complete len:178 (-),score=60.11 TRINITY_DN9611_c0_g1_i1:106-639(-)